MTIDESYFSSISNKKKRLRSFWTKFWNFDHSGGHEAACFRGRKKGSCFLFGATMFVFVTRNYYQSYCYTLFQTFVLQINIFQKVSFKFTIFWKFHMTVLMCKGQTISKWIYEVIVSPKIRTKKLSRFLPSLHRAEILTIFCS